jgi:outer membrane protein assembly factor BamB
LRARIVDVGRGRVACTLSPNSLSVLRLSDGETIWTRELSETPEVVRIRDEFVLTADAGLEHIDVFHLETGVALSRVAFDQPDGSSGSQLVPIAFSAGAVCGPDGVNVTAYEVRTGERLWSLALSAAAGGIFELVDGTLMIASVDGVHRVVDARTGEERLKVRPEDFPGAAVFGAIEEGLLILAGYQETALGETWQLVGVDYAGGQTRWSRSLQTSMRRSHLRMAQGVIPLVVTAPIASAPQQRSNRPRTEQRIVLIDKRTGEDVGESIPWREAQRGQHLTGDLDVWNGRLVLQVSDSMVMYETRPLDQGTRGID